MILKKASGIFRRTLRGIVYSAPVRTLVGYSKNTALPGFDSLPIYDVADFFFTGIQRGGVKTRAQSLAFSFFLALFPAIIFFFSLSLSFPFQIFQVHLLE